MVSSIPQDYTKRLMVFGGRASMELAARISGHLDLDLGQVDLRTFADGEVYCRYNESIRGADVFLVQSTAANEANGMTPNDALLELMVMIDAAQGASAHRIIAVMPWYGYGRQDKKSLPREPISATCCAGRSFSITAQWTPSLRAKLRATLTRPASGETITSSSSKV